MTDYEPKTQSGRILLKSMQRLVKEMEDSIAKAEAQEQLAWRYYELAVDDRVKLKKELAERERTCEQEERGWGTEGDHARVWLTCGHDCMVPTVQDLPNYCPNCGAKVVDE